jgi:H+/Cl- antiporter ClcA
MQLRGLTYSSLFFAGILTAVWLLAAIAYVTNWRDAGGWVDCGIRCSSVQHLVGSILFWFVPLVGILLLVAVVSAVLSWKSRRAGIDRSKAANQESVERP